MLKIAFLALFVHGIVALRYIEVGNKNKFPIWIQTQPNNGQPALLNGKIMKVDPNGKFKYDIADGGWAGRLWPKTGCDGSGQNCEFGQSVAPCPAGGCHPPAETKVEFNFKPKGNPAASFYDISLVDGYSLAAEIIPYKDVSCIISFFTWNPTSRVIIKYFIISITNWLAGKSISTRLMRSYRLSSNIWRLST